jgi:hypothetical protein
MLRTAVGSGGAGPATRVGIVGGLPQPAHVNSAANAQPVNERIVVDILQFSIS